MKKIAVISDVHGNLPALQAVIKKLEKLKPDTWVCLGDIVGYGPFPSECIKIIREYDMQCILGNHDAGAVGELTLKHFRNPNRRLIELTKDLITQDQYDWLKGLPLIMENDEWICAHSSPVEPEKWRYIESAFVARDILNMIDQDICFIGHTHKPSIVSNKLGVNSFKPGFKYLINPGSVGQSRDSDYRASCGFLDLENWKYETFRLEYDTELVLTALMRLNFSRKESRHLLKI